MQDIVVKFREGRRDFMDVKSEMSKSIESNPLKHVERWGDKAIRDINRFQSSLSNAALPICQKVVQMSGQLSLPGKEALELIIQELASVFSAHFREKFVRLGRAIFASFGETSDASQKVEDMFSDHPCMSSMGLGELLKTKHLVELFLSMRTYYTLALLQKTFKAF